MLAMLRRATWLLASWIVLGGMLPLSAARAGGISDLDPTAPIHDTPLPGPPPALKAAGDRHCAPAVSVRVELDLSQLDLAKVSAPNGKKTVTLPLQSSAPFQKEAVTCRYGSGKVSVYYLLQCPLPVKSSVPGTYHCKKKARMQLRTMPVPAPPIRR